MIKLNKHICQGSTVPLLLLSEEFFFLYQIITKGVQE